jgi:3-dehydroquinate synthase
MSTTLTTIDLGKRSYDIAIGKGLLFGVADQIPFDLDNKSIFIVTDENVKDYAISIANAVKESGAARVETKILPAGEATKSFAQYESLCEWLLEKNINRDSVLIAVGGGVIGDLGGFAASTIMRGVSFIQVPTTLLAQVDSSVGGKTGINSKHGKNLIGAFYQPRAVIADIETLKTLPKRELLAGYAEIVKYGLINDTPFFEWLEENGDKVCALNPQAITHAIKTSVEAKAAIVESDEREKGVRALLNLGHTFGHALEAVARYDGRLLHGEAVAIGTIMAFDLSARMGLCAQEDLERVEQHFINMGLPTRAAYIQPALATNAEEILHHMAKDKKAAGGKIKFILVRGIGDAFVTDNVPQDILESVIKDSLLAEISNIKEKWTSAFSQNS